MAVTSLNDIPFDLLEDILSRVPVETLKPLCSINKTWYNLIHSPHFISKHHSHQSTSNIKLLISRNHYDDNKTSFAFLSKDEEDHYSLVDLPTPFLTNETIKYIVGHSINGFICVKVEFDGTTYSDFAFWNIATGEFHVLPKLNLPYPPYMEPWFDGLGFGWVPDTNDYKLVVGINFIDDSIDYPMHSCLDLAPHPGYLDPEFYVYNLSSNSWKQLTAETPFNPFNLNFLPPDHSQICVNGICYWVNKPFNENYKILYFDMRDEVFGSFEFPDFEIQKKTYVSYTLSMLDGCLALIINHAGTVRYLQSSGTFYDDFWVDLWVMDSSWIKKLKIGPFFNIHKGLGFVKDEFFMEDESAQLLSFNSKSHQAINFDICKSTFQVLKYVESLVPIKRRL